MKTRLNRTAAAVVLPAAVATLAVVCVALAAAGAAGGVMALDARLFGRLGEGASAAIPAPLTSGADGDRVQAAMDAQTRAFIQQSEAAETAAANAAANANANANANAASADAKAHADALARMYAEADAEDAAEDAAEAEANASAEADEAAEAPAHSPRRPNSLLQMKAAAEVAASANKRPRGIGHIALPRVDGTMTRVDYARKLFRERIRRRLRSGGMLRRYAPELFGSDVYGMDDNDNVKIGSRATIWDAMNGPFAPMAKPSAQRPKPNADALRMAMLRDAQRHAKADKAQGIRHSEYYLKNDPYRGAYTYLPRNHRNPFGFQKVIAEARRNQALDVGPFEGPRFTHQYANPLNAFDAGAQRHMRIPLPSNPRLPFAEADAAIAGMRPSKLQQFEEFVPPPKIPKFVPAPPADGKDVPSTGQGDTPEF